MNRQKQHTNQGSALVAVVILSAIAALITASILSWTVTESRLNQRHALRMEAKNAAEAAAEWGFYQIRNGIQNASAYNAGMFAPGGSRALTTPSASLFTGGHIDTSSIAVFAGTLPLVTCGRNSATDPNNLNDPLKGKYITHREISVYAKATAYEAGSGRPVTAYIGETLSIRNTPLFAHAIFYNMDLELFPGVTMTLSGPVHANGNIYASVQSSTAQLNCMGPLTCTGDIYHAWKNYLNGTHGTGSETMNTTGQIYVATNAAATTSYSMYQSSIWYDSSMGADVAINTANQTSNSTYGSQSAYATALSNAVTNATSTFRTTALKDWNGYLLTEAHSVQNYTASAIGQYSEQTTTTTDDSNNSARAIIEPATSTLSAQYSADVEAQKFSTQACLYITVTPSTTAAATTTTSSTSGSVTTTTVSVTNPSASNITVSIAPTSGASASLTVSSTDSALMNSLVSYKPYTLSKVTTTTTSTTTSGKSTTTSTSSSSSTVVSSGIYDQRRSTGEDLVELDMAKLRTLVSSFSTTTSTAISTLSNTWNGIVYVEVAGGPTTNLDGTTNAATNSKATTTAVRIYDSANTSTDSNSSLAPSYASSGYTSTDGSTSEGLTIATNAPVYVKGTYNALDGDADASTAASGEAACAIAGDAITILSENFSDANSYSTAKPTATTSDITIAAAFLTGIVPTNKNGNGVSSGGAHNFPRFLENWSSKTVTIRGSMVCLFESRVASEPYSSACYSPPTRNWGFNTLFRDGTYPPGTPKVISYRRIDYGDLTASQYAAAYATATGS